ncbi:MULTISPECIES: tRNA uridine-5-carboxymethylaminomethyl(34) synthesis enzyme MnmG [Mediterranea]|uniref:tRNA uridine-5-carboxymethylaminomethyl(34) synthesis enzyme MnmG n=1 Tax=Mediterranea TaxID=1926659 RepID=UPI000339D85B|nr:MULTISPECIES: tRNA uridine-5-carboxymethylaminomethyl(34) synthesis enzyme MnmG [Mediterranea]MCL1606944.1 tRNA uridine-5-carboxymethylaminomethyl(34) synthesis enzyme MnmG [Mediterranea sp. ET5]MDM8121780.1 tRNA uridine-5-carboxymethylaminomethyl(34) synthesis enzyme MnmG [Mediterranea massiliensis]MDM8197455.1 tRNA uridine-5-carboxymethylaminomethyl(34) synthesis enzyme MnmG [Mediterranea massiliensis]CDD82094.1 tRNA uridine 5-carboxymethylaminomethyl modification enzyme MnmG [Bacteroides 
MELNYDVVVIGAGHAGCEAATAAANLGARVCMVTMDMNKVAQMSCNPAVGGIAKGQIVREVDALGGYMGLVTDRTAIQFRMLNRSKGPAMWSPRAQCDRGKYIWAWREVLDRVDNVHIWQDTVTELLVDNGEVTGVRTQLDVTIRAKAVVLTAGTFLNGLMHFGRVKLPGGRVSEPASLLLTESIARHGIRYARMKTGTPVRIDGRSVDFSLMDTQDGENDFHSFSFISEPRKLRQLQCWTCYTNPAVHDVLRNGLPDSPLYNGQIQSIGPRYCPSIETKIVTFPDKEQHQLFLEPEGENTEELYLNGFSSSLPIDIQVEALKHIPAFRNLVIYRPGYAIEYDFFDPTQLKHTLESKVVKNLFFAGQVNGTTGYEEAAGQGLVAGINAAINCGGGEPFVLHRDEAYIGVLIDDLVTKGVDEPYRMFTSRAEYRILLRQDDADMRLTERAYQLGLATRERYDRLCRKREDIGRILKFTETYSIKADLINPALESLGTTPLRHGCKLVDLINRPQITLENISAHIPAFKRCLDSVTERRDETIEAAEVRIKYQGYIDRERMIAEKMQRLESIKIRGKFDYASLQSLSTEARQKLQRIDPETLAQAGRIPGISPSDINVLLVLMGR